MKRDDGFSFIELLAVLVILGVLTAITVPGFLAFIPNYRLNAAAQEMLGDIQLAKLRAIKQGNVVAVAVDVATDTYSIFVDNGAGANFANGVHDGDEPDVFKTVSMPSTIDITAINFSENAVHFNSRGLLFSDDGDEQITIRNGKGDTRTITVTLAGAAQVN
jgi:type IV fimbrial biogenesis protein FimT